jgi:hypothetical protein
MFKVVFHRRSFSITDSKIKHDPVSLGSGDANHHAFARLSLGLAQQLVTVLYLAL